MTLSFWLNRNEPICETHTLIIGAGISGIGLSWWLSQHMKSDEILLIDQSALCAGASGRNAGFSTIGSLAHFNRQYRTFGLDQALVLRNTLMESMDIFRSLVAQENLEHCFEFCDGYSVATTTKMFDELNAGAEILLKNGYALREVNTQELKHKHLQHYLGGWATPGEGQLNPTQILPHLFQKTSVPFQRLKTLDIQPRGNQGYRVVCDQGVVYAQRVILALNGFLPQLSESLRHKIVPRKAQALITHPLKKRVLQEIVYGVDDWAYFRQLPSHEVLIGGRRILDAQGEVGTEDIINPLVQKGLSDYLAQHFPDAFEAGIAQRWAGPLAYTADGMPIAGEIENGLFALGGYSGHGMAWGMIASKFLAEHLSLGKAIPGWLDVNREFVEEK
jgi:gamma-glutamylputrescine oxidase